MVALPDVSPVPKRQFSFNRHRIGATDFDQRPTDTFAQGTLLTQLVPEVQPPGSFCPPDSVPAAAAFCLARFSASLLYHRCHSV